MSLVLERSISAEGGTVTKPLPWARVECVPRTEGQHAWSVKGEEEKLMRRLHLWSLAEGTLNIRLRRLLEGQWVVMEAKGCQEAVPTKSGPRETYSHDHETGEFESGHGQGPLRPDLCTLLLALENQEQKLKAISRYCGAHVSVDPRSTGI